MAEAIPAEFERNLGFWSIAEQHAISNAKVALAGVGGDGYLLGLSLVRMGVRRLSIADPEVFERENMNRVPGATERNLGRLKTDCFVEDVHAISPNVEVDVFAGGVTAQNVAAFMDGASVVVDETELTKLELGTMISDHARRANIPVVVVMNIGFAAQVTSYHPDGPGFREMMSIDERDSLDQISETEVDLSRCVPYIAPYTDVSALRAVQEGAPLPSIMPGVSLAASLGASQCFLHLTSEVDTPRPEPVFLPRVLYVDALTGESRIVRSVRWSYRRSVLRMMISRVRRRSTKVTYPLN